MTAELRYQSDPHCEHFAWRMNGLVLEFACTSEADWRWLRCRPLEDPPNGEEYRAGSLLWYRTPERLAVWRDLFLHP